MQLQLLLPVLQSQRELVCPMDATAIDHYWALRHQPARGRAKRHSTVSSA
jgi:hypothetical protein